MDAGDSISIHHNFNNMKKIGVYFVMLFVLTAFDPSQERIITGKVTSADDGAALPGVNVVLKGTTTGTVTDHHGDFSLKIPASGGTLVFTFIGFTTQEIRLQKQTILNVQLAADVSTLQEVIVSGYGKERDSAGAKKGSAVTAARNFRAGDSLSHA